MRIEKVESKLSGDIKTVYFAGKVSKGGGYRGKLLNNHRVMNLGYSKYSVNGGEILYGGPFAIGCDHGCFHRQHYAKHGLINQDYRIGCTGYIEDAKEWEGVTYGCDSNGLEPKEAVKRCLEQVYNCDAVHAYLDTISCYGTLVELGYANAFAKPIYIYYKEGAQNWMKHFWFAFNLKHVKCCEPGTETSFHPDLIAPPKSFKERYHEYLLSDEWKHKREAKLLEAGTRCQLCNSSGRLHVHHRTYDRVFDELPQDLIALCSKCHEKFHDITKVA